MALLRMPEKFQRKGSFERSCGREPSDWIQFHLPLLYCSGLLKAQDENTHINQTQPGTQAEANQNKSAATNLSSIVKTFYWFQS